MIARVVTATGEVKHLSMAGPFTSEPDKGQEDVELNDELHDFLVVGKPVGTLRLTANRLGLEVDPASIPAPVTPPRQTLVAELLAATTVAQVKAALVKFHQAS